MSASFLLLALLSACGGDSDNTGTPPAPAPAPAPEPQPVRPEQLRALHYGSYAAVVALSLDTLGLPADLTAQQLSVTKGS